MIYIHSICKLKFKIIGVCKKRLKNIKFLGKYEVTDLPNILERENIDLVFIPSIWPETFSYTTEEAINMGVAVACFNIGAPAERNKDGCIIADISAKSALEEINSCLTKRKLLNKS